MYADATVSLWASTARGQMLSGGSARGVVLFDNVEWGEINKLKN